MNDNFSFEKLNVYKEAVRFAEGIFTESIKWDSKYQFNIADQLRRASLSISLNIAEGSSRTKIDFKRFISIARGSCFECVPIIEIAHNQNLISTKTKEEWYNHSVVLAKMLSKLKSSI